ncbi:MAG: energy transducer TonB [Opitutae bacterium]|nr:energy transducer TonB [Opitutae bacterium]
MSLRLLVSLVCSLFVLTSFSVAKPAPEPTPLKIVKIGNDIFPLYEARSVQPKKTVAPAYPATERASNTSGEVLLALFVNEQGKVTRVEIVESKPSPAFGDAAKVAVLQWRYPKVTYEGKPTAFIVQVPVIFNLN